ncbi:MAG: 4-hydroxy-tetrahydrodipicolinate synthase [Firmicutes bacterium]|nr:4-hydroxy-tetrahydrodipicolinate synthase [Bacillota bacterium]
MAYYSLLKRDEVTLLNAPFGKVVTAMITPFTENGEVSYENAAKIANYLVEHGSDAIVVAGTTGESPNLSNEEKLKLFTTVVNAVKGKAKVIAGTGSNSTKQTVELTKQAEACGVDGIMLVVPYYNKPSQEGLYRHFAAVAQTTLLPLMLYNVPGRTVTNMAADTTVRLAKTFANVIAIKEASGDLEQIARIRCNAPQDFAIYSGDDALTLPILAVGGCGVVSVASHIVGKEIKEMISSYYSGDHDKALAIHLRLLPLFKALFITANPAPVKGAMRMLGHQVGPLRLPLVDLNHEEKELIKKELQKLGYL